MGLAAIVVTHDRPTMLARCLRSLAASAAGSIEQVIVVDDGSRSPRAVAEVLAASFADSAIASRLVRIEVSGGPAAARNAGARAASAPLLWFIDDDVVVGASTPAAFLRTAAAHPRCALGGGVNILCLVPPPRVCDRCSIDFPLRIPADRACGPGEIWSCNLVIPNALFAEVGGFPAEALIYGEEYEFLKRLVACGGRVWQVADADVDHMRSAEDLRFMRLVGRRWVRGRNQAANAELFGWSYPPRFVHVIWAARKLAHAVSARCVVGLLEATSSVGSAVGPSRRR